MAANERNDWSAVTAEWERRRKEIAQRLRESNRDIDARAAREGMVCEYDEEMDILVAWIGKPTEAATFPFADALYVHYDPASYKILGFEVHEFRRAPRLTPNFDVIRHMMDARSSRLTPESQGMREAGEQLRELVRA